MRQQKAPIDYQLNYMERLFYNMKHKKTESYVIHRIWDKLDDTSIRLRYSSLSSYQTERLFLQICIYHSSASSLK